MFEDLEFDMVSLIVSALAALVMYVFLFQDLLVIGSGWSSIPLTTRIIINLLIIPIAYVITKRMIDN